MERQDKSTIKKVHKNVNTHMDLIDKLDVNEIPDPPSFTAVPVGKKDRR